MIRVLGLALYGPQAASHRVRLSQFHDSLLASGISLHIQSFFDDAYIQRQFAGTPVSPSFLIDGYVRRISVLLNHSSFDLAIVYGDLLPLLPGFLERSLLRLPFIYDLDDSFYLKYRQGRLRWLRPFLGTKIDNLISSAVSVTAGNAHLSAYSRSLNPNVTLFPSVVNTDILTPVLRRTDPSRNLQPFTVGWIGSPSTSPYLTQLIQPLQQLALERPVRLIVVGAVVPSIPGVQVVNKRWSLDSEASYIRQFDVGVMPLPDTPWTLGKCAFKLIQCMSCGIPVIASRIGANVEVVTPAVGFLVSSPTEWLQAFRLLASDPQLRQRMGQHGRQRAELSYSIRSSLPTLISVIRDAYISTRLS